MREFDFIETDNGFIEGWGGLIGNGGSGNIGIAPFLGDEGSASIDG